MHYKISSLGFITLILLSSGCGSSGHDFHVEMVTGTVICNGKPVPHAVVYFEPLKQKPTRENPSPSAHVGKMGIGRTGNDGTFRVTTYEDSDGAVVGPHKVRVGWGGDADPACPCVLDAYKQLVEVEVKSGEKNEFNFNVPLSDGSTKAVKKIDD